MFVLLLFNRLMGPQVLDVQVTPNVSSSLHVYAHCHPARNGSLTMAFINVDPATAFECVRRRSLAWTEARWA
jgi:hypothetical protein